MTTPAYDPNIPQFLNDSLAITQPQFLRNFQTLFDAFLQNHVTINDPNGGNHTFINLLQQLNSIETNPSEISIYTKDIEDQTTQVFFRYQGNGQEFQFTNYQLYSIPPTIVNNVTIRTQYFTVLPGKIMVYFGMFLSLTEKTLTLFPPVAKNIMTVSFCPIGTAVAKFQTYKPEVVILPPNQNDFIDKIKVQTFLLDPPPCFYIVLANL